MPRRLRDDLEPVIRLPDVQEAQQRANDAVGEGFRATVRRRGESPVSDGFMFFFDGLGRRLAELRGDGIRIDEGLVYFMAQRCEQAHAAPVRDGNGGLVIEDGHTVHTLRRVGCRVRVTQDQIAFAVGRSRSFVNEQIRRMKDYFIIVNQGRGWYEFDASLCWRGGLDIRKAYAKIQRVNDDIEITDEQGITTTPSENGNDDGNCGDILDQTRGASRIIDLLDDPLPRDQDTESKRAQRPHRGRRWKGGHNDAS